LLLGANNNPWLDYNPSYYNPSYMCIFHLPTTHVSSIAACTTRVSRYRVQSHLLLLGSYNHSSYMCNLSLSTSFVTKTAAKPHYLQWVLGM